MEILEQMAEPGAKQMQVYKEMARQRLGKPLLLQKLIQNWVQQLKALRWNQSFHRAVVKVEGAKQQSAEASL